MATIAPLTPLCANTGAKTGLASPHTLPHSHHAHTKLTQGLSPCTPPNAAAEARLSTSASALSPDRPGSPPIDADRPGSPPIDAALFDALQNRRSRALTADWWAPRSLVALALEGASLTSRSWAVRPAAGDARGRRRLISVRHCALRARVYVDGELTRTTENALSLMESLTTVVAVGLDGGHSLDVVISPLRLYDGYRYELRLGETLALAEGPLIAPVSCAVPSYEIAVDGGGCSHAVFEIELTYSVPGAEALGAASSVAQKMFSQIADLHEMLESESSVASSAEAVLPQLPPKTLTRRLDVRFCEARRIMLKSYFSALCAAADVFQPGLSLDFAKFFELL